MDGIATFQSCPACGLQIPRAMSEAATTCPACGQALPERNTQTCSTDRPQDDSDDANLIADLQAAFSGGTHLLEDRRSNARQPTAGNGAARGEIQPGTRLGDFEIVSELGRGGMGIVYRARQLSLNREVALKVLPSYARYGPEAVQRFRIEAQAAARLHHTNVVAVYAQGEFNGLCYYAMELIDGVGLDLAIRSRPELLSTGRMRHSSAAVRLTGGSVAGLEPSGQQARPEPEPATARISSWSAADYRHLASLVAEIADALALAHSQGVVHRDVKPHNLLLSQADRLHLTDFGLARLHDSPHLTLSGEVLGTPAYLSPEQVSGGAVDHRTDIYSLGVTLYELITRRKPFEGQTRDQIMHAITHGEPLPVRRLDPQVPADLETICRRAMSRDPAQRHPSAALLAEDLRRFAAGRPILSRRTSRLEQGVKWVRRHKAQTAAIVATTAVAILATTLGWSWRAATYGEARQRLQDAYSQLAYNDFRQAQAVAADIERAARLGLEEPELPLARALAALGAGQAADVLAILGPVRRNAPDDPRSGYLLSWAHARNRDAQAARSAFAEAEAQGGPQSADAWFFRGMAQHFDDPAAAAESYRRASAARAAAGAFYPQALLHLARARNQQMYATRSLDSFEEARAGLRQLIENGYYGAFPYYLLSTTHRLAAEIYADSSGTRPQLAAEHRAAALDWARRGQLCDPADDRPVTALAHALESAGDFEGALVARTQAIELATADIKRCEGFHYRWRLHYWSGDLDAAAADLAAHARCDPNSVLYASVFPALVAAEAGDLAGAREQARAIMRERRHDPYAVLWTATALRLLGATDEAAEVAAPSVEDASADAAPSAIPASEWVTALLAAAKGQVPPDHLQRLAEASPDSWKLMAEAEFHLAVADLARGCRAAALERLRSAYRAFDGEEGYTYVARLLLVKCENLSWPDWLELSCPQDRVAGLRELPAGKG